MPSLAIRFAGDDKIQFDQLTDDHVAEFLSWFSAAGGDDVREVPAQGEWKHYVQKRNINRVVVMP